MTRTSAIQWALAAALVACSGPGTTEPDDDVVAPLGAGYELRLRDGDEQRGVVAQVLKVRIDISRDDTVYDGPITFTAEAEPGFVVAFRPMVVLREYTDVILIAERSVAPGRHDILFRGTAPGREDRTALLHLDLAPAP